jgi:hypothetical protein
MQIDMQGVDANMFLDAEAEAGEAGVEAEAGAEAGVEGVSLPHTRGEFSASLPLYLTNILPPPYATLSTIF